jgi:hypothetical protein
MHLIWGISACVVGATMPRRWERGRSQLVAAGVDTKSAQDQLQMASLLASKLNILDRPVDHCPAATLLND